MRKAEDEFVVWTDGAVLRHDGERGWCGVDRFHPAEVALFGRHAGLNWIRIGVMGKESCRG